MMRFLPHLARLRANTRRITRSARDKARKQDYDAKMKLKWLSGVGMMKITTLSRHAVACRLSWLLLACLGQGGALAEITVHARALSLTPTQSLEEAVKQGDVTAKETYARQRYGQEIHRGFGPQYFAALFLRSEELPGLKQEKADTDPHRGRRDRVFAGLGGIRFTRQVWQGEADALFDAVQDSRWTFPSAWAARVFLAQRLPHGSEGLAPHALPTTPEHALGAENFHVFTARNMGKPVAKAGAPATLHWRFLMLRDNVVAELDLQARTTAAGKKESAGAAAASARMPDFDDALALARIVQGRLETQD